MNRFVLAIRIFFRTLFNAVVAQQTEQILTGKLLAAPPSSADKPAVASGATSATASKAATAKPAAALRSEALTLLATLQREARLVDFLREDLTGYSDAQIGAAVRDVHRDSAAVLERVFALRPVVDEAEGASVTVPVGFDAATYHLVGNVTGQAPFTGRLCHHGWRATRTELPTWAGTPSGATIVVAAEVELS